MEKLNLPEYEFRYRKNSDQKSEIFDEIRKRFVALTPEEWVRQNFIKYLTSEKGYPASLIYVEMSLKVNKMLKRCDIVVYNMDGKPTAIVECKSAETLIKQEIFDQAARYNITLKVNYLIITNGISHLCAKIDHQYNKTSFLRSVPFFSEL